MKYRMLLYWLSRLFIAFVISFVLLFLSLFCILLLPPVQNFALAKAHPLFENVLYGKIKVGSIQSNLLSYAKLNNVQITDTTTKGNDVFIDYVIVNFWLPALLQKKIAINLIKINKISINILRLKDREFKFPAMPKSELTTGKEKKSAFQLHIKRIVIDTLRLAYIDKKEEIDFNLHYAKVSFDFIKPDSLSARFTADRVNIKTKWWIGTINTISTLCIADPKGVQIDSLLLQGPEIYANSHGYIPFSSEQKWNLYSSIIFKVLFDNENSSLLHKYIRQGVLHSEMHWGGPLINPIIDLKSQIDNLQSGKLFINSISINGVYADTTLISDVKTNIGKTVGNLRIQSKIPQLLSNPRVGDYTLFLSLESEDLESIRNLIPQLKNIRIENLKMNFSGRGNGVKLPSKADLICSGFTKIKGKELLSAEIALLNNYWNLSASWADNVFSGEGVLSKEFHLKGTSKITLNEPELISRLLVKRNIKGKVNSTAQFSGSPEALDFNSKIKCDSLQWKNIICEKLTGEITLKNKQFSFKNLKGKVSGTFDSLLRELKIDSSGGQGSIEFNASGKFPDVYATAKIESKDIFYKRIRADLIESNISISTLDSIFLDKFTAKNGLSKITANGNCFLKNGLQITMQGKSELQGSNWTNAGIINVTADIQKNLMESCVKIDSMDISAVRQWLELDQTISGIVTSNVKISGSLQNPRVQSDFYLKKPGINNISLRDIRGKIFIIDSVFNIEGQIPLNDSGKQISLKANIPFQPGNKFLIDTSGNRDRFISIKSDTINISDLGIFIDQNFTASGSAYLDLSMSGNKGLWKLDGKINLLNTTIRDELHDITVRDVNAIVQLQGNTNKPVIEFRLRAGNTDLGEEKITETRISGKYNKNTLLLDSGIISVQNRRAFVFSGKIPIASSEIDKLLIRYEADEFPLKFFGAFMPELIISDGYIEGKGTVYFVKNNLQTDGLLNIRNGEIETEIIEQKIGPIDGDILLKGDSILFNNWKGRIEKGAFTVSGSCFAKKNKELGIDLVMKGKDITLDAPDLFSAQMNDVKLRVVNTEKKNHYVMKGKVDFGTFRFTRNVQIQDITAASASQKTEYQKKSIMDSIELQLVLQFQDNLYIDMNLGDMQLDGNLAVSGTAAQPALVGKIEVVQGDILYLDRKFTIDRGSVTFLNPLELNPVLYLEAGTEVNTFAQGNNQNITYIIKLKVTGNLQHPLVTLSSDPPLNEPNIISVLTLGTTLGSVGSDITSRIGSLVGNEILGFGTQRLEQLLGLESITVTGNIFNRQNEESGPLLTLTKRLSDRLTVSYETGIGTLNQQRVSILYRLFPFLFFSGQTDNTGNANVNLRFRINR